MALPLPPPLQGGGYGVDIKIEEYYFFLKAFVINFTF